MSILLNKNSLYTNQGNPSVLKFLDERDRTILDVGCGAGDTAKLIRSVYPSVHITGITCSPSEYEQAVNKLDTCLCIDIERDILPPQIHREFDVLLFCHVLEHLVDPLTTIRKLLPHLKSGGKVIILLPNVANWRERWKFALGRFEYTNAGVMDKTHLHFYTFSTAFKYLINPIPQLKLKHHLVSGNVPLCFLRHRFLMQKIVQTIDELGCRKFPNLFGYEIQIMAYYTKG